MFWFLNQITAVLNHLTTDYSQKKTLSLSLIGNAIITYKLHNDISKLKYINNFYPQLLIALILVTTKRKYLIKVFSLYTNYLNKKISYDNNSCM